MQSAKELAFKPLVQAFSIGIAHIGERHSGFAIVGQPDHLSFAAQFLLIARKREFELNYLAGDERRHALQTNASLADVGGLSDESSEIRVDESRFRAQGMPEVPHALL